MISSFLLGVLTGFFVTAVFWVKALNRIIRRNQMRVEELTDQLEYEKADKQTP